MIKKFLALLALGIAVTGHGEIKTPDFAYPKTVKADAEKALKDAGDNGIEQLECLMQLTVADNLIDKASRQKSLERVLDYGHRQKNEQVKALFNLYAASIANSMYSSDRWKYDGRDIPLSPRPADMTEWSGDMFRTYVDSLLLAGFDASGNMPISEFLPLVKALKSQQFYFPTLRDFATAQLKSIASKSPELKKRVESILEWHKPGTAPWYAWTAILMEYSNEKRNKLLKLYEDATNKRDALVLWDPIFESIGTGDSILVDSTFINVLNEASAVSEGSVFSQNFKNFKARIYAPYANAKITPYNAPNKDFDIVLKDIRNLSEVTVTFHGFTTQGACENYCSKKTGKPFVTKSFTYKLGKPSPLKSEKTVTAALPAGFYAISLNAPGKHITQNSYSACTYIVPVMPVLMNIGKNAAVMVYNTGDGKPAAGVTVSFVDNKGVVKSKKVTDADGCATFRNLSDGVYVRLSAKGFTTDFNSERIYNYGKPESSPRAEITTERGLYHPGDTVRYVAVVVNDTLTCEKFDVNMEMLDRDGKQVAKQHGVTDQFGRFSGTFAIPTEVSRTGNFRIIAKKGAEYIGQGNVTVSDYKLAGIKINDLYAVTNMPAKQSVTVGGNVTTFSGQPVANSDVNISVMYNDSVSSITTLTDNAGAFKAEVKYPADFESGSMTAKVTLTGPDGESVESSTSFNGKYPYSLNCSFDNDGPVDLTKPLNVKYSLTKALVPADTLITPLQWSLSENNKVLAKGTFKSSPATVELPKVKSGYYRISFEPADTTLAQKESRYITVYDPSGTSIPDSLKLFFIPVDELEETDGKINIPIGVNRDMTVTVAMANDKEQLAIKSYALTPGYHDIKVKGSGVSTINIIAVRDGVSSHRSMSVSPKKETSLKVEIESFRDKLISGSKESWNLKVTDNNGKPMNAAVVANIHDYRLDLMRPTPELSIYRTLYDLDLRVETAGYYSYRNASLFVDYQPYDGFTLTTPGWKYELGRYLGNIIRIRGTRAYKSSATLGVQVSNMAYMKTEAVVEEEAIADAAPAPAAGSEESPAPSPSVQEMRVGDIVEALWAPMLTTRNGNARIDFTVPNANSTWIADITVWTQNLYSERVTRKFTSRKPVMVSVNAPRFLRVGDRASVIATYMNTTDSTLNVRASLAYQGDSIARDLTIAPHASETINIMVKANTLASDIAVTARGSNGVFADGERHLIPVLSSQSEVTEAINFYINPGDTIYSMKLPQPKGTDFSMELTYTENPMWTVVEALPTLLGNNILPTANSQAAAYFSAAIALGLMEQHPELEYKFNRKELRRAMENAENNIYKLQTANGSFQWGPWSKQGDMYTTASVLDFIATLKRAGYLDKNSKIYRMIPAAVKYYDGAVRDENILYTIVRPAFPEVVQSLNGQSVTHRTLQYINKNWKKFDIGYKAQSASALHFNHNDNMARKIMESVDQFGTQTANKGYEFKNVTSLQTYAWLLQAYGGIDRNSPHVNGIRQYLIVHKQATDWGNSFITSWIINAMINSGTPWTTQAEGTTIRVDSGVMRYTAADRMGTLKTPVSGENLVLECSGKTPSYGAVTQRYIQPMADVKAFSDGEISVEKQLLVLDKNSNRWVAVKDNELKLGDRVKVIITVKTDRPMSQVTVEDARAAAFEPVKQLPGFLFADGAFAYLENRDAQTNLYIDYLPKGTYLFEYELNVNNSGEYSSGIATATCTMAPTLTAHSSGQILTINGR